MHCLCDAPAFDHFIAHSPSACLTQFLQARLDELLPDSEDPFLELIHFYILDPSESAGTLVSEIGLDLLNRPIDLCVAHSDWFDLTVILGDDGFGLVIFVPTSTQDAALRHRCIELSRPSAEADR